MDDLNEDRQWPEDERLPLMPGREDCMYNLANLSREEFFWLAEHRPVLTMPSIYVLQFTFRWNNHCYRKLVVIVSTNRGIGKFTRAKAIPVPYLFRHKKKPKF